MFAAHGAVASASVITDRETGRSKGFGFSEMSGDQESSRAISALHGKDVDGRSLTVNEARPPGRQTGEIIYGSRYQSGGTSVCQRNSGNRLNTSRTPSRHWLLSALK